MIDRLERRLQDGWRWLDVHVPSRARSAILLLTTGAVLGIALWLDPAPEGHSTHTQLGLGTCSFLALTGHPCPMCGATTTFTLLAHLRVWEGITNQPFAALLFFLTVGTFGISLAETVQPRFRWARLLNWLGPWEGILSTLFLLLMGGAWVYKIILMW